MRKKGGFLIWAFCFIAIGGLMAVAGVTGVAGAESGDIYVIDSDHPYFDCDSMKNLTFSSKETDIRFGYTGSTYYFQPYNGTAIADLGPVDFEGSQPPASSYSMDRATVYQDHVYAVRTGNGNYAILKVTAYDAAAGVAEFLGRSVAPPQTFNLYYLNGDMLHFDLDTMRNATDTRSGDLYFRYTRTVFRGENDATVRDLGALDFEGTEAPPTGYSSGEFKAEKDHVYAIRTGGRRYYLILVTRVGDGDMEFTARPSDPGVAVDLYYVSGDDPRFDLETMKNTADSHANDISFKYTRTSFVAENGAALKDLGPVDYQSAQAPQFGYSTAEFKAMPEHVYAIRTAAKVYYVFKVTHVNSEVDLELMARRAAVETAPPGPSNSPAQPGQYTDLESSLLSPGPADESQQTTLEPTPTPLPAPTPQPLGEVKGGQYVYNGQVVLKISGTLDWACISPNGKYVAYRDGRNISYYEIATKKHIQLYQLTSDEYMGKYVYKYGFTSPINYDFVRWTPDSKAIIVNQWTKDVFKGGSGNYQITLADKKMTYLGK